ncbi:MAG TPA: hypothetical protein VFW95_07740 [Candidatus Limnocylindria bacterium]|nr:hypothetical protein [Candidatus Limnocylindria bacterium]
MTTVGAGVGVAGRGVAGRGVGVITGAGVGRGVEIGGGPPPIGGLSGGIGSGDSVGSAVGEGDGDALAWLAVAVAVAVADSEAGPAALPSTPSPWAVGRAPVASLPGRSSRPPAATKPAATMTATASVAADALATSVVRGVQGRDFDVHGGGRGATPGSTAASASKEATVRRQSGHAEA